MNKIKITGGMIFAVAMVLAALFSYTGYLNRINSNLLNTINEQKAFTQEIAKNVFYSYKNKNASSQELDESIRKFLANMNNNDETLQRLDSVLIQNESEQIMLLWNDFYSSVQIFREQSRTATPYSNILLEEGVKEIYNKNRALAVAFNRLVKIEQEDFKKILDNYQNVQYMLFILLLLLLFYLFIQLKTTLFFIQKFLQTSKNIITNSTVKALKPISVMANSGEITEAADNFNFFVHKINDSIRYSSRSIEHSVESLEAVEKSIEDLLELLGEMEEAGAIDKELTKKEDTLIQSFEELANSAQHLKALKSDLELLLSHKNLK
ncbi:MAG: hypothetical protein PF439_05610 [Helicobacteraceae bacterium]|nr:hypothetical protein [Helicobacteraceae bacterium]